MQKKFHRILFLWIVVLSGLATWLWLLTKDQKAEILVLQQKIQSLEKKDSFHKNPTSSLPDDLTLSHEKIVDQPKPQGSIEKKENIKLDSLPFDQIMNDPEVKETMRSQRLYSLQTKYRVLLDELHLNPQEKEVFYNALMDHPKKTAEEALQAILGNDRFAKYQEYNQSLSDRKMTDLFRNQLAYTQMPLQDSQSKQLLQVLKEEREKILSSPQNNHPDLSEEKINQQFQSQQEVYQHIIDRAASFLSPEQLDILASHYENQLRLQETSTRMANQLIRPK